MKKIFDVKKKKDLNFFVNNIKKTIKKHKPKFDGNLSKIHKNVSHKEINNIRIDCFRKINSSDWIDKIKIIFGEQMYYLLGQDLLIQSKINVSIQMPDDKNSILNPHSDCWSADSPFQLNLWIPLTRAYSTNSMFLLDNNYSLDLLKKISKNKKNIKIKKPKSKDFIKIKYGQALIFNPGILHGNVLNKTKDTRVSLNVRFKSVFSPGPDLQNPDRKYGTYYKNFNISKNTKLAIDILNTGVLN